MQSSSDLSPKCSFFSKLNIRFPTAIFQDLEVEVVAGSMEQYLTNDTV